MKTIIKTINMQLPEFRSPALRVLPRKLSALRRRRVGGIPLKSPPWVTMPSSASRSAPRIRPTVIRRSRPIQTATGTRPTEPAAGLLPNVTGSENTATGYAALFFNRPYGTRRTVSGRSIATQPETTTQPEIVNGRCMTTWMGPGTRPTVLGRLVTIQWATTTRQTVLRRSVPIQLAVSTLPWGIMQAAASARADDIISIGADGTTLTQLLHRPHFRSTSP